MRKNKSFKTIKLSKKNDERYAKMIADYKKGKVKTKIFENIDEFFDDLER